MRKEFSDIINKLAFKVRALDLIQQRTEDQNFDGKHVTVKGREFVYYGSCSYLGLETDERLKKAAIEAVNKYGAQFSCSRMFLEMGMYGEIEEMLGDIMGKPTLLAPTTSLGHVSVIPIILGERDAVIADQQVHNSVRNALQMAKGDGVHIENVPHNDMNRLETRIQILRHDYERIWYFADGVYSMYGDAAPFGDVWQLLEKYEQFHFYVDDAHGMSWAGKHGRGLALQSMPYHPRMMVITSLAKGFGNCGGALTFYDEEQKTLIKNCGSSFIFSGPLQPAVLGAVKASAEIHLSDEIETMQSDLFERMVLFVEKCRQLDLPLVSGELTPIFYIAIGKQEVGAKIMHALYNEGMFCNLAMFPAVSIKNTGLRVVLTRNHSLQDISKLLDSIAHYLPKIMEEENYSMDELYEDFKATPLRKKDNNNESDKKEETRKIA